MKYNQGTTLCCIVIVQRKLSYVNKCTHTHTHTHTPIYIYIYIYYNLIVTYSGLLSNYLWPYFVAIVLFTSYHFIKCAQKWFVAVSECRSQTSRSCVRIPIKCSMVFSCFISPRLLRRPLRRFGPLICLTMAV